MASQIRKDAQRMADAIRAFRNLPMLMNQLKLRENTKYAELCHSWENYSDKLEEPFPEKKTAKIAS